MTRGSPLHRRTLKSVPFFAHHGLLPVAVQFGVDPLQFGSIMIFNLMIGLLTPPMGGVVFVLSSVTGIPVERAVSPTTVRRRGLTVLS